MLGVIKKIATNSSGFEYGIILAENQRYRFDSRNTNGIPMSDFYKDDCVEFVPSSSSSGYLIANDVRLAEIIEGKITSYINHRGFGHIDDRFFFHRSNVDNINEFDIDTKHFEYIVTFCETLNPERDNSPVAIGVHIEEAIEKMPQPLESTPFSDIEKVSPVDCDQEVKESDVSIVLLDSSSNGSENSCDEAICFYNDVSSECAIENIQQTDIADVDATIESDGGSPINGQILDYFTPGYSTYIKKNKDKIFERFLKPNSGEDVVLDKLSELLCISRIGSHGIDQSSTYQFCVAGATSALKQYIAGKHEFLIVFSHFDSTDWQSKTLRAEREIRKRHEIADRYPLVNFYILISNARTLRAEVDNKKGGSTSAIIPFTFEEIISCNNQKALSDLVLSRFNEYYFENNMLGETTAIDDDNLLFGDRGKIADTIAYRCKNTSYSGIFGLRRSGKSSVLNAVFRRLERQGIKYIKIESGTDLENLDSWKTALFDIAKKVRECTLGIKQATGESRSSYMKRLELNSTEDDYAKRASQYFVEDIKLYCRNEESFVIALDEVEKITYNTTHADAWCSTEAFCGFWSALRDCGCAIIVCGVNSTIDEINTVTVNGKTSDNPMRGRIKNCAASADTYLPSFTDDQTKYMINTLGSYSGIAFSNVYQEINRAFGGQPYAIRQFCSYVFEKVRNCRTLGTIYEVQKPAIDNLLDEFSRSSEGYSLCDTILQHVRIFQKEYSLLCDIALSPKQHRKMSPEEIKKIDHLVKYGIIEWDSSTNYISFRIHIIQEFLSDTVPKNPSLMSNEERRRYVQDNVAKCERKLKAYIKQYYIFSGSEADCRKYFTTYINSSEKKGRIVRTSIPVIDPSKCPISDFFDHKKLILYFSSLKWIISNNWSTVGTKIDSIGISREKFVSSMDDLNAGRTDADHYDAEDLLTFPDKWEIDEQTMQGFVSGLATMNRIFEACGL